MFGASGIHIALVEPFVYLSFKRATFPTRLRRWSGSGGGTSGLADMVLGRRSQAICEANERNRRSISPPSNHQMLTTIEVWGEIVDLYERVKSHHR